MVHDHRPATSYKRDNIMEHPVAIAYRTNPRARAPLPTAWSKLARTNFLPDGPSHYDDFIACAELAMTDSPQPSHDDVNLIAAQMLHDVSQWHGQLSSINAQRSGANF